MNFLVFLKPIGALLKKAFKLAVEVGVTDELIDLALKWARVAESKFVDNAEKREFVVKMLVAKTGVPESIARLAVELAMRLLKKELQKLDDKF
jgi:hypothetical protein